MNDENILNTTVLGFPWNEAVGAAPSDLKLVGEGRRGPVVPSDRGRGDCDKVIVMVRSAPSPLPSGNSGRLRNEGARQEAWLYPSPGGAAFGHAPPLPGDLLDH